MLITDRQTGYPSVDKPWLKYYDEQWYSRGVDKKTVYRNIYERNRDYPDNKAVNFKGHYLTYGELFDRVESISKALLSMGIKKGDSINLCVTYTPEAVCLVLACSKIGVMANFIDPLFSSEQKAERFNDTDSDVLIVLDVMFPYMKEALAQINVKRIIILPVAETFSTVMRVLASLKRSRDLQIFTQSDKRYVAWKKFIEQGNCYTGRTEAEYEEDRPVVMVYSSGTTGASKGIVLTNEGINSTIEHYVSNPGFRYERKYRFLSIVPIWYSTGNVLSMLMPLGLGVCLVLEPLFSPENFRNDILRYKPNMLMVATSLLLQMEYAEEFRGKDLSFIKYPITGGEKILPENEEYIGRFLREHNCTVPLLKGYGMCELGSTVASESFEHRKTGSVGYPIKGVTVSVFDIDTNEEMKTGQRGEIRVISPAHMKEYYKNPEATEKFFCDDQSGNSWGCTGDIGYMDEEGFLYILGRAADCFWEERTGRVYFFDIEDVILKDSSVKDCKVVQTEDNKLVAHVVLAQGEKGQQKEIISRIADTCRSALPEYAVPTHMKVRNFFPVRSNGKRDIEVLQKDCEDLIEMI